MNLRHNWNDETHHCNVCGANGRAAFDPNKIWCPGPTPHAEGRAALVERVIQDALADRSACPDGIGTSRGYLEARTAWDRSKTSGDMVEMVRAADAMIAAAKAEDKRLATQAITTSGSKVELGFVAPRYGRASWDRDPDVSWTRRAILGAGHG